MITFIFIAVCLAAAGYFKGRLDATADTGKKTDTWKNKYKRTEAGSLVSTDKKDHWWYFGLYTPNYAEKFPFSSTMLVFLTDKWHLSQFIMLRSFYTAIAISLTDNFWLVMFSVFIIFPITLGIAFEAAYSQLRSHYKSRKKKKK